MGKGRVRVGHLPTIVIPMMAFRSQFCHDLPTFAASPAADPCPAAALSYMGFCRQLCSRVHQGLGKERCWAGLSVPPNQPLDQQEDRGGLTAKLTRKTGVTSKRWKWPLRDARGDKDPEPTLPSVHTTKGTDKTPLPNTCMSSMLSARPACAPEIPSVSSHPAWSHTTSYTPILFSPGTFQPTQLTLNS